MRTWMAGSVFLVSMLASSVDLRAEDAAPSPAPAIKNEEGYTTILDDKSFKDWKVMPGDAKFTVEETDTAKKFEKGQWSFIDGELHAEGGVSHIFSPREDYENLDLKADVKISDKGNSGMYFRVKQSNGFPPGYECQVNSTHGDPKRTGSLYNFVDVKEMLVPPNTWFAYEVIAEGTHIIIKVNEKVVVDFDDKKNTYKKGHVAFQQHNQGSEVWVRNVRVKELPPSPAAPAPVVPAAPGSK